MMIFLVTISSEMTNLNENSSSPSGNGQDLSENLASNTHAIAILLKTHNDLISNIYKTLAALVQQASESTNRFEKLGSKIDELKESLGVVIADRSLKDEMKEWREFMNKTITKMEESHEKDRIALSTQRDKEIDRLMSVLKISEPRKHGDAFYPQNLALQQMALQQQFQHQQQAIFQQMQYQYPQNAFPVNFSFASPSANTTAPSNQNPSYSFKFTAPGTTPVSTSTNENNVTSMTSTFGGFSPFSKANEQSKPTIGEAPLFGNSKPALSAEAKKESTPQSTTGTKPIFGGEISQTSNLFKTSLPTPEKRDDSLNDSQARANTSGIFGGGHGMGASFGSAARNNSSFLDKSSENSLFGTAKLFDKPVKSKAGDEKNDNEHESDDRPEDYQPDVEYAPVIPLPELVHVQTGEEHEQTLFEGRCKLFRYFQETKEFKERGVGIIKILKDPKTNACRAVMRRDQVHKVCANFKIVSGVLPKPKDRNDKAYIWKCNDFSEGELKDETFVAKFKNAEEGLLFKKAFDQALGFASNEIASSSKVPQQHKPNPQPSTNALTNSLSLKTTFNGSRLSRSNASTSNPKHNLEDDQDYEDEEEDYDEDEVEVLLEENCFLSISNGFVSPLKAVNAPPHSQYNDVRIYIGIDAEIYKVWFQETEDSPEIFPHYINMNTEFTVADRRIEYNAQDIYTGEIKRLAIQFSEIDAMTRVNDHLQQGKQCAEEQNFEGSEE